jgi:hypothetical protein
MHHDPLRSVFTDWFVVRAVPTEVRESLRLRFNIGGKNVNMEAVLDRFRLVNRLEDELRPTPLLGVSFMDPVAILGLVDNPALAPIAADAAERLRRVAAALES